MSKNEGKKQIKPPKQNPIGIQKNIRNNSGFIKYIAIIAQSPLINKAIPAPIIAVRIKARKSSDRRTRKASALSKIFRAATKRAARNLLSILSFKIKSDSDTKIFLKNGFIIPVLPNFRCSFCPVCIRARALTRRLRLCNTKDTCARFRPLRLQLPYFFPQ